MKKLLIANRGEIAIRVIEAAAERGLDTVALFSEDDAKSLHLIRADEARQLRGVGAAAYLDGGQIIAVAQQAGSYRRSYRTEAAIRGNGGELVSTRQGAQRGYTLCD
jgi:pyruvate carboxylase